MTNINAQLKKKEQKIKSENSLLSSNESLIFPVKNRKKKLNIKVTWNNSGATRKNPRPSFGSKISVVPDVDLVTVVVVIVVINATRVRSSSTSQTGLNVFKRVVIHDAPGASPAASLLLLLLTRVVQVHGLQRVRRWLRSVISVFNTK